MLLALGAWSVLGGCSLFNRPGRPDPSKREDPRDTWIAFRRHLDDPKGLGKAYSLLSEDTRERYKYWEFSLMMTKTRFGELLRYLMVTWEIHQVRMIGEDRADLTIRHPYQRDYFHTFEMIREDDTWKIRFTLAQALGMPEEDERYLFPESFGDAPATAPGSGDSRKTRLGR